MNKVQTWISILMICLYKMKYNCIAYLQTQQNILQLLGISIFKPLKLQFSKQLDAFKPATLDKKKCSDYFIKCNIVSIFKEAFENTLSFSTFKNVFRKDKSNLMPDSSANKLHEMPPLANSLPNQLQKCLFQ